MELEMMSVKELKPHPKNPRIHPESALAALERSIIEFGWTNPVILSKDGYILAGHARVKAAMAAGIKQVPIIRTQLEGVKAEAYMIADNKLHELTEWDLPNLKDLLQELDTGAFSMDLTGFDEAALETLMTQVHIPDFSKSKTPTEEAINQREAELKRMFEERTKAEADTHVQLSCPECGANFSIRRGDLDKKTTT